MLTEDLNKEIAALRHSAKRETNPLLKAQLQQRAKELLQEKRRREDLFFESLRSKLEQEILEPRETIRLKYRTDASGKKISTFARHRASLSMLDRYVALKLSASYRVDTRGRDQCIRILTNIFHTSSANPPSKQGIHKVDIAQFFEAIPHDKLLERLVGHSGVPHFARQHVSKVLKAYRKLHGSEIGVPRGIPSSSVLAEIYLEPLDFAIRTNPDVVLYLRYVDDIIVVCDPARTEAIAGELTEQLAALGLKRNDEKSRHIVHPANQKTSFEYLGYRFNFSGGRTALKSIDISDAKLERYKCAIDRIRERIDLTCLADKNGVDFLRLLLEYLLCTHASHEDREGQRVVTGLAYSARFMMGSARSRPNFKALRDYATSSIRPAVAARATRGLERPGASCRCCNAPIAGREALGSLLEEVFSEDRIMRGTALRHESEEVRVRVRNALWS